MGGGGVYSFHVKYTPLSYRTKHLLSIVVVEYRPFFSPCACSLCFRGNRGEMLGALFDVIKKVDMKKVGVVIFPIKQGEKWKDKQPSVCFLFTAGEATTTHRQPPHRRTERCCTQDRRLTMRPGSGTHEQRKTSTGFDMRDSSSTSARRKRRTRERQQQV